MAENSSPLYSSAYYGVLGARSYTSAMAAFNALRQYYVPTSVVDVGCGNGVWLKAALELGAKEIKGLDGEWVTKDVAVIPFENIQTTDLSRPFTVSRTFDLALSMEVAEHLPGTSAKGFVVSLTRLAPVILFSAAAPEQGGTGHINNQWPAYWAKLFRGEGYLAVDAIRKHLWNDPQVEWWYAQNSLLYIQEDFLKERAALRNLLLPDMVENPLPLVHPEFLARANQPQLPKLFTELIPGAIWRAVKKRLPRL